MKFVTDLVETDNDQDSKHLRNVGKLLPDYTALQPRRQCARRRENLKSHKTK
jgi:hypothetical protein